MKTLLKASSFWRFSRELLLCSMVGLSGCAQWLDLPPSWTGEPDESVVNAPREVGTPPNLGGEDWPNLADVPDKPTNFVPQSTWTDMEGELSSDQKQNNDAKARLEAEAPDFNTATDLQTKAGHSKKSRN